MMDRVIILIPVVGYIALTMFLAVWCRRYVAKKTDTKGFLEEYFIGGRSMGAFVLAMTIIATYTSASSFVGGPGIAYALGFGWVLLAMIQVPTTFLTLGVLGKRFAIIGRKINGVTIVDFLHARYKSDAVVIICSVAMIVFFMASMLAQFIGGGRVFQAVTGYSYEIGLFIFGISVIVYTTFGGFRAVAVTDAMQGVVMLIAAVVVLLAVLKAGGGMTQCVQTLKSIDPGLLTPNGAGGKIPNPFLFSFWILVGLGILGLPQTVQRCFGYKDSRAMHNAMIMGTFIIGFLLLCAHLTGTLGRAVLPDLKIPDLVMPTLTVQLLPPFWAGVFVAGPLAAIMSTVSSMLLLVSAAIVKDLYIRYTLKGDTTRIQPRSITRMSFGCTLVVGVLVFLAAFRPPDLLVWINLFAFGGLEAVFLWPIVLGLYWKRANAAGTLFSIMAGLGIFMFLSVTKIPVFGLHPIVPTLLLSFGAFWIGIRLGRPAPAEVLRIFWED
ncbi:pantothenate:sodium symporter [uncultured delta proteobacterium]|uniref:Pantothenate:sodium symporter n=1 Tax=uncultured delta proteobacterium TaxID=34034 RepID=A0A212ITS0_9DELT|nr:pantothenate:sodium symporter [uncultured delta proteobacterium]